MEDNGYSFLYKVLELVENEYKDDAPLVKFVHPKELKSPQDCTARRQNAFGRETPHLSTIRRWYTEFDRGRVSLYDEIRESQPLIAVTEENVATVRQLIEENRRITYEEIREHLGIASRHHMRFMRNVLPRMVKFCNNLLSTVFQSTATKGVSKKNAYPLPKWWQRKEVTLGSRVSMGGDCSQLPHMVLFL
ncbi:hypothetical protein EVAR_18278_1 [Eumeta japonica]|uniref:Mos1 transposase HTH domain-containing protein n=1 Tax=Eumeta variegata TaxID=151549 RepID=A0A4C1UJM6_EUMVA|nr:hypothetical protein EVAR_18278_1 [Eumeta japonica]